MTQYSTSRATVETGPGKPGLGSWGAKRVFGSSVEVGLYEVVSRLSIIILEIITDHFGIEILFRTRNSPNIFSHGFAKYMHILSLTQGH